MTGYDETTLPRAAALFGPQRVEFHALGVLGDLLAPAGQMQAYLAGLLAGDPINKEALLGRIADARIRLADLYLALNLLDEALGAHPVAAPYPLVQTYEDGLRRLEQRLQKVEADRACRYGMAQPRPDTYAYDKHEVLDMVCTMAAREAAEKEEPHGTV